MDPIGFALENFDAIGAWRDKDGELRDRRLRRAARRQEDSTARTTCKKMLLARKDEFVSCLTEKMLTYALGRGMEHYDRCTISDVVKQVEQNDHRFSALVHRDRQERRRSRSAAERS